MTLLESSVDDDISRSSATLILDPDDDAVVDSFLAMVDPFGAQTDDTSVVLMLQTTDAILQSPPFASPVHWRYAALTWRIVRLTRRSSSFSRRIKCHSDGQRMLIASVITIQAQ